MTRPNPLRVQAPNDYPTRDGRPVAETDWHRDALFRLIRELKWHFRNDPADLLPGTWATR